MKILKSSVEHNVEETFVDSVDYNNKNNSKRKSSGSFNKHNKNVNIKLKETDIQNESEKKRLASLKKHKQTIKAKEQIIRNALSIVDNKRNNKIIFDDNTVENYSNNDHEKKLLLFDNDDEGENDLNLNGEDYFNTDNNKQRFRTIGGDERFRIDERHLDDDKNKKIEDNEAAVDANDEFTSEKNMQMEILQNVLGKPIMQREGKNVPEKRKNQMIRYDPNENNHRDYEIEHENVDEVSKKKRKKKNEAVVVEEPPPIPVSNEIFYSVSNTLCESLKPQEEFSLLKTFGTKIPSDDEKNNNKKYEAKDIPKKSGRFDFTQDNKNPFQYDSSDGEDENPPKFQDKKSVNKSKTENIPLKRCDSFFFIPNDPRFREAEEFFQTKSTSIETFKNVRRELKQIVRSKIRNNARKARPFKKKIGTKSQSK